MAKKKQEKTKKKSIISLKDKIASIYSVVSLETTCPGHCVCCHVACPQMNYSEFLVIVNYIYDSFPKEIRVEILKKSIEYFFSSNIVKPCPLLIGKRCSVYKVRPLSCILYGLWPDDMYNERVEKFEQVSGLKKEEIPLNTQCEYVKRVDDSIPLTKEIIEAMYLALNELDVQVGDFTKEQVEKKYNQRTWHDWFMVNVFGESNLYDLSRFYLAAANQNVVDDFVKAMCNQVDAIGDHMFKRSKETLCEKSQKN